MSKSVASDGKKPMDNKQEANIALLVLLSPGIAATVAFELAFPGKLTEHLGWPGALAIMVGGTIVALPITAPLAGATWYLQKSG